jgi:hypothetical protein
MTTPEIIHTHPLTEEMLAAHRDHARGDGKGYRAHMRARRALEQSGHAGADG